VFVLCDPLVDDGFVEDEREKVNLRGASWGAFADALGAGMERCGAEDAPSDEIGVVEATNGPISDFGVSFGH
jgi:hypothetical protein